MSRRTDPGMIALFKRADKLIEVHTTLEVLVNTPTVKRNYYFATAPIVINGISYEAQLRTDGEIKSSLGRSADPATVDLQNADNQTGLEFLSLGTSLPGSTVRIGRWRKDLKSGIEDHQVYLTGVVVGVRPDQNFTKITAVPEPYARVSVGATRRVVLSCQWNFRDPATCGYAGSELKCNFLLNDADGCAGRHGSPLNRAKIAAFVHIDSAQRFRAR
jgi:hypothetical protein